MRKFAILGLVVAVVLAMSVVAMADTATDLSINNAEDSIGVTLDIGGFADVSINQTNALSLEPTAPGLDSYEKVARDHAPVTILANTAINVDVRESVSRAVANEIGDEYVEAIAPIAYPGTTDDFENTPVTLGFGAWLLNDEADYPGETGDDKTRWWSDGIRQGAEYSYAFGTDDENTGGVSLEASNGVVFDGYVHMSMVWYGQDWQELTAGSYSDGDVIITVSA